MPYLTTPGAEIYFEVTGSGPPLLLLAPGGLDSTVDAWQRAAINPLELYADEFQLISMDQRNAGRSTGRFEPEDPWGSYLSDQLGLMDHLGFTSFHVMGCCIGCSYALGLSLRAPDRILSAVLEQPIGLTDDTRDYWVDKRRAWVANLLANRDDLDPEDGERFGAAMWGADFVGTVNRETASAITTPLLVLPGTDAVHPAAIGLEIADLAPNAEAIDPWKDTPDHIQVAADRVRSFLAANTTP